MPDVLMVLKKHMTKKSLPDWSESWKCARTYSRQGQPSVAQCKKSWFSRYQPHKGREYRLKEAGHENDSVHHPIHEVFHLPQRCHTPKMHGLSHPTEREKEKGQEGWLEMPTLQAAEPKVTCAETVSRWFKSWIICYTQPQGSWVDTGASQFQHSVVWSRRTGISNHLFANLKTDTAAFRLWGQSFVILKGESKLSESGKSEIKFKESGGDGMVIMSMKMKTRKYIYSRIDKDKLSEERWIDCHKNTKINSLVKNAPSKYKGRTRICPTVGRLLEVLNSKRDQEGRNGFCVSFRLGRGLEIVACSVSPTECP